MLQLCLVYIVLVLPHTDALWVYFYQLCQWIHQSPSDAHGTAHRHILFGELLACHLRC